MDRHDPPPLTPSAGESNKADPIGSDPIIANRKDGSASYRPGQASRRNSQVRRGTYLDRPAGTLGQRATAGGSIRNDSASLARWSVRQGRHLIGQDLRIRTSFLILVSPYVSLLPRWVLTGCRTMKQVHTSELDRTATTCCQTVQVDADQGSSRSDVSS